MNIHLFTLTLGIIYTLVGVLGFVPGLVTAPPANGPSMATDYGMLLGLFPINFLHNWVHLGVGIGGLIAYKDMSKARRYNQSLAVVYGILAVMGLIPRLNTAFGYIPLYSHDIWLHALTAIAAGYYGFMWHMSVEREHHHA